MSVYQIEEYYVSIMIDTNQKEAAQKWLDNYGPADSFVELTDNNLTIEGFDMESSAEQCEIDVKQFIKDNS